MIYVITADDEYNTIEYVLDGRKNFDFKGCEAKFYKRRPKATKADFVMYLRRQKSFRLVDFDIPDISEGYIKPYEPSHKKLEPWAKEISLTIDDYVRNYEPVIPGIFKNLKGTAK